ncbi:MAG TPA: bifunctional phosphopantothenoylcysteine decarboxylase/phosphopantothenate--cysteine ligase CoaBC [Campylobacterales bacterium]|nr:bifunctional phosphopantothenoylcysteine decarboxylase/phosphopantothenate--cysteine ligase CoaBC [Campylobacterales bacterium]HHS91832.1 bifunctional phosphopantothenoylcysteine decarboxylase/phosphopantothenate--cysteine ligase CoaBC [Campylobacterales bacterium]
MQINLKQKTILLGVTGSISAYKACDLARLFIKAGASVHVLMTSSAERFVSALTFEALTRNAVLTESSESWATTLNHIDIGKKCDAFVIAPATANTINKMAQGIADNILLQTVLAYTKPLIIAPAANTKMIEHFSTLNSLKILESNGVLMVNSQSKLLACGDTGNGALAEPQEIFYETTRLLLQDEYWKNRKVLVTGGGTREKIDEVRYVSNFSSGKMANALATALYLKGAEVTLITTKEHTEIPAQINCIDIASAKEMKEQTFKSLSDALSNSPTKKPFLFMAAAVADFTPKSPNMGKTKKVNIGKEWNIEMQQTDDILKSVTNMGQVTIGFKAEMDKDSGFSSAKSLIENKNVDGVCYNLLTNSSDFGTPDNQITFIHKNGSVELGRASKLELAFKILRESKYLEKIELSKPSSEA